MYKSRNVDLVHHLIAHDGHRASAASRDILDIEKEIFTRMVPSKKITLKVKSVE